MSSVVIFHGDNQVVMLQKIKDLKERFEDGGSNTYSLKTHPFDQILLTVSTPTFFAEKRLVIIEDAEEKKVDLTRIPNDPDLTVVLIFKKELSSTSTIIKEASTLKAQIISFSQPQDKTIFTFLDLLAEKNNKAFEYLDPLLKNFGGQYLLTMLLFLLRRLTVPPQSNTAPFIRQKVEKQQKNFSQKQLTNLYRTLLETDYLIKTGKREDEQTALTILIKKFLE